MMSKVLFVVTGARYWTLADGTRHPTGYWAEELVAPFFSFTRAGFDVVVATPGGAVPVVDRASLAAESNGGQANATALEVELGRIEQLRAPIPLEKVDLSDYVAVFYPGGHGPMEDLSDDDDSARLLAATLGSGKPLGLVCHAPAALLATQDPNGSSPFAGYRLTGFTNAEETQAGLAEKAKWLLQDRLVALGADFEEGQPWVEHIVVDRNLHTGQNPASSGPLADEMVKTLAR
jgi:putative intracellular protease/amidase